MNDINWKKYPEELPKKEGRFLVKYYDYVSIAYFEKDCKQYDKNSGTYYAPRWEDMEGGGTLDCVEYFQDLPK